MIEYYRDIKTGEVKPNQLVRNDMYIFWRDFMLREEDKAPNVVAVLTGDWDGVILENDKKIVRIEPIRFILPDGNKKQTVKDFLEAKVELPANIGDLIDESQIEKVRRAAYGIYKFYVYDNQEELLGDNYTPPVGLEDLY